MGGAYTYSLYTRSDDLYLQADDKDQVFTIEGTYSYQLMQGGTKTEQVIVTQPMLLRTFADTATTEAGIEAFSWNLELALDDLDNLPASE